MSLNVTTDDGVRLHAEVTGRGPDVLFLHEFSGDHASWEPQVRHLARRYRCITFAARGFWPSDVPEGAERYSQSRAVADACAVLDAVGSERAHAVGISMGAFTALNLVSEHRDRMGCVVAAGCGYGAGVDRDAFRAETEEMAGTIREHGAEHLAELTAASPFRLRFQSKDPRGFDEWKRALARHDAVGLANTILGVQRDRLTLLELGERLADSDVPILLLVGDEDEPCLDANLEVKRRLPRAGLCMLPNTAHTVNLEEPQLFNQIVESFLAWVDAGTWPTRDPRSRPSSGGWIR